MACDSLLTTSLLQVLLLQVDSQNVLSTSLLQVVSTCCNKSANDKCCNKPDFNKLVAT